MPLPKFLRNREIDLGRGFTQHPTGEISRKEGEEEVRFNPQEAANLKYVKRRAIWNFLRRDDHS